MKRETYDEAIARIVRETAPAFGKAFSRLPDQKDRLRSLDTMSDAIALSSPSGRMSKRARKAAEARLGAALFPPGSWENPPLRKSPEHHRAYARTLRELAAHGMRPRVHIREAERLEALA